METHGRTGAVASEIPAAKVARTGVDHQAVPGFIVCCPAFRRQSGRQRCRAGAVITATTSWIASRDARVSRPGQKAAAVQHGAFQPALM
jgi:hypothetical protein